MQVLELGPHDIVGRSAQQFVSACLHNRKCRFDPIVHCVPSLGIKTALDPPEIRPSEPVTAFAFLPAAVVLTRKARVCDAFHLAPCARRPLSGDATAAPEIRLKKSRAQSVIDQRPDHERPTKRSSAAGRRLRAPRAHLRSPTSTTCCSARVMAVYIQLGSRTWVRYKGTTIRGAELPGTCGR